MQATCDTMDEETWLSVLKSCLTQVTYAQYYKIFQLLEGRTFSENPLTLNDKPQMVSIYSNIDFTQVEVTLAHLTTV